MPNTVETLVTSLNDIVALFKAQPPSQRASLIAKINWAKLSASSTELSQLSEEFNFISEQILIADPNYFQNKINNLKELNHALNIKVLSFAQKKKTVQEHCALINAASKTKLADFIHIGFLRDNMPILELVVNSLSPQDLLNFSKKYIGTDKDYLLALVSKINNPTLAHQIFSALLPSIPNKEQCAQEYSARLAKKIGLIMGLSGEGNEGSSVDFANAQTKQRFNLLSETSKPLAYHTINNHEETDIEAAKFYKPLIQHGDLQGIHTRWQKHSFSFHLIKDNEKTHLIYVNRGERHEGAQKKEPAVSVFSFTDEDELKKHMHQLVGALQEHNEQLIKTKISQCIASMPHRNPELSIILAKSDQKSLNCTIANANSAWHLALASQEMKDKNVSFEQAYENTRQNYKKMRQEDRAKAFCELMTNPYAEEFRQESLFQIIKKMTEKDEKIDQHQKSGRPFIPFLVKRLYETPEKGPAAVHELLSNLCHGTYKLDEHMQLRWIKACVNTLSAQGQYSPTSNKAIEQQIKFLEELTKLDWDGKAKLINQNTSLVNSTPKDTLWNLARQLNAEAVAQLSKENVQFILQELSYSKTSQERFINQQSSAQLAIWLKNKALSLEELPESSVQKYSNSCKEELKKILRTGADATTSQDKKKIAQHLINKLDKMTELNSVHALIPILYQTERIFSHVRNPLLTRNRGGSETNSYKATKEELSQLRKLMSAITTLDYNTSDIIQDKPKSVLPCASYKKAVNDMKAEEAQSNENNRKLNPN